MVAPSLATARFHWQTAGWADLAAMPVELPREGGVSADLYALLLYKMQGLFLTGDLARARDLAIDLHRAGIEKQALRDALVSGAACSLARARLLNGQPERARQLYAITDRQGHESVDREALASLRLEREASRLPPPSNAALTGMPYIDVIGPQGSGKSKLVQSLCKLDGFHEVKECDKEIDNAKRNEEILFEFLIEYPNVTSFIEKATVNMHNKEKFFSIFSEDIIKYNSMRRTYTGYYVFNEGFVCRTISFAYTLNNIDKFFIRKYLDAIPLPSHLIAYNASVELCIDRIRKRARGYSSRMINLSQEQREAVIRKMIEIVNLVISDMEDRGIPVLKLDASDSIKTNVKLVDEFLRETATPKCAARSVPDPVPKDSQNTALIVYTVALGDDPIPPAPEVIDPAARYLLFTDKSAMEVETWEVVQFDTLGLNPARAARLPKILPHRYLPAHDVSVYVDAQMRLTTPDLRRMAAEMLQGRDIAGYQDRAHDCIFDALEGFSKAGKAGIDSCANYLAFLEKEQFPQKWGLLDTACLIRRDSPLIRRVNDIWFKEYLAAPARDQFSLMHVLHRGAVPFLQTREADKLAQGLHFGASARLVSGKLEEDAPVPDRFTFLEPIEPATLVETVQDAIRKMDRKRLENGLPAVSTRLLRQAIDAITWLELQGRDEAQTCRDALSALLFPEGAHCDNRQSLKLAYIANSPMPTDAANNVHVMKMCSAFAETGTEVVLYSEKAEDHSNHDPETLQQRFGTREKFPVVLIEREESVRERLLYRVVRRAIEEGCSHIYTRSLQAAVHAALAGIPVIFEEHKPQDDDKFASQRLLARSPSLQKLVVISKPLRTMLASGLRGMEDKIVVMHDGADPVSERPEPFDLGPHQTPGRNVGYVGHLYPGKGAELCWELARRMPQVTFHMLGGMPEDIAAWQEKSRDIPNLVFHGHRPHAEVPGFIESVDICIAPFLRHVAFHRSEFSIAAVFSPLKIFEYMAHGKPIVTSDLPVLREVLTGGETALMCDPDHPETFVSALERLIADPALGERLGQAAKAHFEGHYTWSERARRIRALLDASRPGTPPRRARLHR